MPDAKYRDQGLAEKLYPIYEKNGTIESVFEHCRKSGAPITKPTLGKMAGYFFWKEKRDKAIKNQFQVNTGSDLNSLLTEVTEAKNSLKTVIDASPGDTDAHGIYGRYIAQILAIQKTINSAQAVDKDRLLVDALKGVVNYLVEKKEKQMAEFIGEALEEIAEKVKDKWR